MYIATEMGDLFLCIMVHVFIRNCWKEAQETVVTSH